MKPWEERALAQLYRHAGRVYDPSSGGAKPGLIYDPLTGREVKVKPFSNPVETKPMARNYTKAEWNARLREMDRGTKVRGMGVNREIPWNTLPDDNADQRIAKWNEKNKQEGRVEKLDQSRGAMSRLGGEATGSFRGFAGGGSLGQLARDEIQRTLASKPRRGGKGMGNEG